MIRKLASKILSLFAGSVYRSVLKNKKNALHHQQIIFFKMMRALHSTDIGKQHRADLFKNYEDYKTNFPIFTYETMLPYIEKIKQQGAENVLWKGRPLYFAKTSGTTAGVKYIPITKDSIKNHIRTAQQALMCYVFLSKKYELLRGKLIFLSGSPVLETVHDIPTGRLSGIVNHHIPWFYKINQLPSWKTNCIDDWDQKLSHIVAETVDANLTLISGIPPWIQMYFDKLRGATHGKKIGDIFPNLSLIIQGGVNFEPYKTNLINSIGRSIDFVELYPASEGFLAFQEDYTQQGLLLNTNSNIFFEFVEAHQINQAHPLRLWLGEVELYKNYVLLITSNAGLWSYNLGDTVQFVSLNPYKIKVTGRTAHYLSAFGEHVIEEEVNLSIAQTAHQFGCVIRDFTVGPKLGKLQEESYHLWCIEFETSPQNRADFETALDAQLRSRNVYYDDLIKGNVIQPLKIVCLKPNAFNDFMRTQGKLGGQNKIPHIANNDVIIDQLMSFRIDDR